MKKFRILKNGNNEYKVQTSTFGLFWKDIKDNYGYYAQTYYSLHDAQLYISAAESRELRIRNRNNWKLLK